MPTFGIREIEIIHPGKLRFSKLVREKDCPYDDFVSEIEEGKFTNYQKELNQLHSRMQILANENGLMPSNWFNSIKDGNKVIVYEFKTASLRLYCVKKDPNVLVIMGGFKKEQKKDIKNLKKQLKQLANSDIFQHELSNL